MATKHSVKELRERDGTILDLYTMRKILKSWVDERDRLVGKTKDLSRPEVKFCLAFLDEIIDSYKGVMAGK
jgi:hypothetical protein